MAVLLFKNKMTFGSAGALACASSAVNLAGAGEGARTYLN